MHQPDSAADTRATKMAHPAMLPRKDSNVVPALGAAGTPAGGGGGGSTGDSRPEDYPPPLLIQAPAAASSSSLGLQQQQPPPPPAPPQSLTLLSQQPPPQTLSQAGAQLKKKSGFQITSVTPAQISASLSSNNSIAEDTESYDDLDESHTEDLSSSEILDASLSRATDLGEPERSSSEETLNNFQEAETPGAVSPNQPRLPQQQHPPQQQSVMINGSMHPSHGHHHHHHHRHGHHHASHSAVAGSTAPGGPPPSPSFRKLSTPGSSDGVPIAAMPVSAASSSVTPVTTIVSHFRTTPGVSSSSGAPTSTLVSAASGSSGAASSMPGHVNINLSNVASNGSVNALSGVSGTVPALSGVGSGTSTSSSAVNNANNPVSGSAIGASSQLQPAASTSRFRVVKLDSSSEPFKKGRWTCSEFYDKENPVPVAEGAAVNKAVDTLKQNPLEVTSERESTSGSSVSSNVSTLSHYTESVGSGEIGAPPMVQQQPFQGAGSQQLDVSAHQLLPPPSMPQSISQPQLTQVPLHPQDESYSPQKQGIQPPASGSLTTVPATVTIGGGHQHPVISTMAQQQLPYSQSTQSVQTVPVVPQSQQLLYGQGQVQHPPPPVSMQVGPGHAKPMNQSSASGPVPDYIQHQQMLQPPAPSMQSGPTGIGTGTPVSAAQASCMQPSIQAHLAAAPSAPVAHAPTTVPIIGASAQMMQGNVPPGVQQPPVANPVAPSAMPQSTAPPPPSQVEPPVPAGVAQPGPQASASSLPQPLVIAPQSTLLSVQTQLQATESLVQGMAGQSLPAVSPNALPVPCHSAVNVPSAPLSLVLSKTVAQSSGTVQNGKLAQTTPQPPSISTSINLPVAQHAPQLIPLNSTQFSAQSLAQSVSGRGEDSRRSTEPILFGLPQLTGAESGLGASLTMSDGGSSMASSLFPLKVLPLTAQLVDGEDER